MFRRFLRHKVNRDKGLLLIFPKHPLFPRLLRGTFVGNVFIKFGSARLTSWERRRPPLGLAATAHKWRGQRHLSQWYAGRGWSEKAGRRSSGSQAPVHLPVGRGKTVEPVRQAGEDNVGFVAKAELFHHALEGDVEWQGPACDLR